MENHNTPYNSNFLPDIKQNNDIHANSILLPTIHGHHQQIIPQHLTHHNMYMLNVPQAQVDQYQQQQHQAHPPQQGLAQQQHHRQHHHQQQQQQQQQQPNQLPPIMQPHMVLPHPYYQQNVHLLPQQQSQPSQHVQAIYPQQHIRPQPLPFQNYQAIEQRNLSSELLINSQSVPQIRSSAEQQPQSQVQVGHHQHENSPQTQIDQSTEPGQFKTEKNPKRIPSTSSRIKHQKKVSAFVTKLYSMLHDPSLSHLIWWSRLYQNDTTTFALLPGTEFASCLTTYFKHGNVASFVRQLHMYGFHKVCEGNQQHLIQSSYDQNHTIWEFRHTSGKFRRGDQSHLHLIKRRANSRRTSANPDVGGTDSVNASGSDVHGEPLQQQSSISSKDMDNSEDSSVSQTRVAYKPVYFTADENSEVADSTSNKESESHGSGSKESGKPIFTAPAPKILKDPFEKSHVDPLNRVVSPTSGSHQDFTPAVPFQAAPHQQQQPQQQQVPPLPRPYSPTGRLSPVSYRQNVFFQESRQRYPSVFIDPCAPAPSSTIPDRARSPPLPLPVISSQPQPTSQAFLMSPRNMRSITESNTSLPPISSISSQASIPQSPGHSISSTKSGRFFFSRNSSATSSHTSQLRPSIFDIHHAASTTNSSISAQNSIFSGSSISSTGSIGSRFGSSISSMLNDDRRYSSFAGGSISSISVPLTSSSLKTVTSFMNEANSSLRSETPVSIARSTSISMNTDNQRDEDGMNDSHDRVSIEPSRSTSKITELLNRNDTKDNTEPLRVEKNGQRIGGRTDEKGEENYNVNGNVHGDEEEVTIESK